MWYRVHMTSHDHLTGVHQSISMDHVITCLQITQISFHQHESVWVCVCVLTTCLLRPKNQSTALALSCLPSQIPRVDFRWHRATASLMQITMASDATGCTRNTNTKSHWMKSVLSKRLPVSFENMWLNLVRPDWSWLRLCSILQYFPLWALPYTLGLLFRKVIPLILPFRFRFHVADLGTYQFYACAKQVRCTCPLQGSADCLTCRLICITSMLTPIALRA